MNRKLSILTFALLLLACSFARGQAVTATPVAVNQSGIPLGSTLVTICTSNPGTGTCGSLVTTYTSIALAAACTGSAQPLNNQNNPLVGSGCSNPGYTDNLGNVVAFTVSGPWWCQYSGPTIVTYSQPCPSGGGGSSFIPQTNGTPNAGGAGLNFVTSSVNANGLTITPVNPSGIIERFEITGNFAGAFVNLTQGLQLNGSYGTLGQCPVSTGSGTSWGSCATGSGVTLQTNGTNNTSQSALNIQSQNNVGNYGDWFCSNPSSSNVLCNVGGWLDLNSSADGAPGGGVIVYNVPTDVGSTNAFSSCPVGGSTNPIEQGIQSEFISAHQNTGSSTYQFCSLAAKNLLRPDGSALVGGDIPANYLTLVAYDGTAWRVLNPKFSASGAFGGQQQGQPTIGATPTTATTEPATYVAQAFSGTDLCAKITAALNQCPTGAVNACRILIDATTPGSADVCASGTSNFFSGVPTSILAEFELRALLQLKAPVIFPAAAHLVHGIASSQNFRGSGFIMDPSFADSNNNCNFSGSNQGPFPAGHYLCLVIDGGGNWSQNAFGGKWRDLSFDCNGVTNCIPYYTGNEQEDSGWKNVRVWGLAAASATSVSACGFWDHSVATGGNSGPSHWAVEDSYCDPWGNGSSGTTTNNTIYGFVYEGQGSGGNVLISRSTVRANSSTQLMVDGVWIDGSNTPDIKDIHCEWLSSGCVEFGVGLNGTTGARASNISDANHSASGVHFGSGSKGGTVFNVQAQGAEVQDDANSVTTSGSTLEFYTQDDGGQGFWNGAWHVGGSGNTDRSGNLTFAASTSQTYTFAGGYSVAPQCQVSVTSSAGTTTFWPTTTTTVLTIHASASFSGNVNYECTGRGN